MAERLPEDIAALCNHAGLDSSHYKDFTAQRSAATVAAAVPDPVELPQNTSAKEEFHADADSEITEFSEPDFRRQEAASQPCASGIRRVASREGQEEHESSTGTPSSNLFELPLPAHRGYPASHSFPAVAENPRAIRDRWPAIQNVFSRDTVGQTGAVVAHRLPAGSISIFAAGGGVGKTTIAATLARVLTAMAESILLAGLSPDSLLPLYFGARSAGGSALRSFLMSGDRGHGSLHLYLDSLSPSGRDGGDAGVELLDRLYSQADVVNNDIDRALLVLPAADTERLIPLLAGTSLCLAIIVPDLASAVGVGKIMRFFQEHRDRLTSPYFLINKFDATRVLHQEMYSRLKQQVGERLLPLVIRRGDEIQDALAAGTTIIDYAPSSGVVQDFHHLADWILGHPSAQRAARR